MLDQVQEHIGIHKAAVQRIAQLDRLPASDTESHAVEYQQQVSMRDEALQNVYSMEERIWRMLIKGYLLQLSIQVHNWLRAYNVPVNPDVAIQFGQIQVTRERIQQGDFILPQRAPTQARTRKESPFKVQVSMSIHKPDDRLIVQSQPITTPKPPCPTPSRWPTGLWALEDLVPPQIKRHHLRSSQRPVQTNITIMHEKPD